jgi:hypothetical protein
MTGRHGPNEAAQHDRPSGSRSPTSTSIRSSSAAAVRLANILMPANPDLANKPEVVKGLRQIVRGFGPKS